MSHCVRKAPTLTLGQPPDTALWPPDQVTACPPEPDVIGLARPDPARSLGARRLWLYARIDVFRDRCGRLHVADVEGTEPSLFFPDPVRGGIAVSRELGETCRGPAHGYRTAQINLWILRRTDKPVDIVPYR